MSEPSGTPARKTPLNATHRALGARMVDFAGWDMPVQYHGVVEEHLAVRTHAGLFDVSHMGEIEIRGDGALAAVQRLTCNDAARLAPGLAQYSAFTTEQGTFVDDIIVYCLARDRYFICVNASNASKDFAWVASHVPKGVTALNRSDEFAQIAIQGPEAEAILRGLTETDIHALKAFTFAESRVAGVPALVARTGYTGEDGFELYCESGRAAELWDTLMGVGAPFGLTPCGLGARDTLRLEACLMLYGNDIDDTTTVVEAGLNFILKLDKGEFIGRDALARQKAAGAPRRLVAFEMVDRGVARHGYPAQIDGAAAGHVTSGTFTPFLKKNLGMAYLPAPAAREGHEFDVVIRGKPTRARVVKTPHYKRPARSAGGSA
ncbi:MAG TPA: glycine cleavage system aminomethyltransferase GcvT [Verrucomicrobiae bacterium]|nr:glycine cleavage system aminomethyltransferase GcvT [Verrucomicrobiae bacterium]